MHKRNDLVVPTCLSTGKGQHSYFDFTMLLLELSRSERKLKERKKKTISAIKNKSVSGIRNRYYASTAQLTSAH